MNQSAKDLIKKQLHIIKEEYKLQIEKVHSKNLKSIKISQKALLNIIPEQILLLKAKMLLNSSFDLCLLTDTEYKNTRDVKKFQDLFLYSNVDPEENKSQSRKFKKKKNVTFTLNTPIHKKPKKRFITSSKINSGSKSVNKLKKILTSQTKKLREKENVNWKI